MVEREIECWNEIKRLDWWDRMHVTVSYRMKMQQKQQKQQQEQNKCMKKSLLQSNSDIIPTHEPWKKENLFFRWLCFKRHSLNQIQGTFGKYIVCEIEYCKQWATKIFVYTQMRYKKSEYWIECDRTHTHTHTIESCSHMKCKFNYIFIELLCTRTPSHSLFNTNLLNHVSNLCVNVSQICMLNFQQQQ